MTESNSCCLCGADYGRYGHNPDPVSSSGRCCDTCNATVVIPARLSMMGFGAEDTEGRKPYPRNLPSYPRDLPSHSESVAERKEIEARMLEIEDMENPSQEDLDNLDALESRYFELTGTFGSEEGFTPTHPPMEFGEMVDWRPLDGTPSLKRQRAEDDYVCQCGSHELRYVEYDNPEGNGFFCMNCGHSPCGINETDNEPCTCDLDEFFHRSKSYDAENSGFPAEAINMEHCESCQELTDVEELYTSADDTILCDECYTVDMSERDHLRHVAVEYDAEDSGFPAEAIQELKRNIVVFTGGAMMLSVFTAIGGFLLGRKTKEC